MIRVVIADDHAIVREGIRRTLADTPDIQVTGEAGDGRALLAALTRNPADVVLLDLAMPGTPGLELLEELRRRNPSLPVLVLSMYPAEQYAVRAIQAGAAGYINKASPPAELLAALRAVAGGHRYISPDVAESLAMHLDRSAARNPHNGLSNREYEVMCLIARGRSASEIADSLGLSVKTVSTYRRRILEKLNLIQNAEITRYAIEHALIE